MKPQELEKLTAHYDKYFEQDNCTVLHLIANIKPHVDVLVYPPNDKYPFWKLATAGASDVKMNIKTVGFPPRNEYMMFVPSDLDLTNKDTVMFFQSMLMEIAYYPVMNKTPITYGHSLEWGKNDNSDMEGAYIEFPQIIADPSILTCKLGMFKECTCLQVVLLTRADIERLLEIGSEAFSNYLYPEEDGAQNHFLSEQYRTDKF